jgi:hypothetical protein
MKPRTWLFSSCLLLLCASLARAQCPGIAGNLTGFGPVTGAPFSADYFEVLDPLKSQGGRSYVRSRASVYRDSEGRTRCEVKSSPMGDIAFVIIRDPVTRVVIWMHPREHVATVTHVGPSSSPFQPLPDHAARPHEIAQPSDYTHTEEQLSSQVIEGLTVTGRRSINTMKDGAVLTIEEWYSPDLKSNLLSTMSHPDWDSSEKVINIQKGDPDPSLFQVPQGYTVKDLHPREPVCK